MGTKTTNYNLYKPSLQDSPPDITSTNGNWDAIDTEMKRLSDLALPVGIKSKLPTSVSAYPERQIWLSPSGSDSANGEYATPMKTISGAIAKHGGMRHLQLVFKGTTDTTYTETNQIKVVGCSSIELVNDTGKKVTLNLDYSQVGGVFKASNITFGFKVTDNNALSLVGVSALIQNCTFNGAFSSNSSTQKAAVAFTQGSVGTILNSSFTDWNIAIYATQGSTVYANSISGSTNKTGYYANTSTIAVGASTMTATTLGTKANGGLLFRNSILVGSTANTFVAATT